MTASLKLISHKLCPYVQRAVIALNEKGVPFERIDIDLANKPKWFLKLSPLGKVPVLVVTAKDEVALFESNVICEYIEETKGGVELHPVDALARAHHRAWMEFGSAILGDLWGLETTTDPATFESKRQALAAKFARVEAALSAGPFFAGNAFSLVDAVFAPIFRYFDVFDELTELGIFKDLPKVQAWRAELAKRPSVRNAVGADYPQLLRAFLARHDAHLLKLAA
ncbi:MULTISPECIES: glutathione S-transferase family protein [unclassified Bradyrhizobium]|uniref:glutathione S-transferase family protein n=1 Tax=unclassified Bradyrhizobium TaxID=2631580 RepID=UPI001FFB7B58|nr:MULTISPECIES: glutathione S-transferase family protein [unclassified Bradyrhizobium]MCK1712623.1 glutathione S-transferase family protein [Bradyrhizobium sp. 143]MCK1728531.1 glutathione S-transferase family protein [Bradyrhizobium sp. 142]